MKTENELGEFALKLMSFEDCMERINFQQSIYTFRRRLEELCAIKRQRKREKKASLKGTSEVSSV